MLSLGIFNEYRLLNYVPYLIMLFNRIRFFFLRYYLYFTVGLFQFVFRSWGCDSHSLQALCYGHPVVSWEGIPHHTPRDDQGDEERDNRHQL